MCDTGQDTKRVSHGCTAVHKHSGFVASFILRVSEKNSRKITQEPEMEKEYTHIYIGLPIVRYCCVYLSVTISKLSMLYTSSS